jgi:hypothetical protein
MFKWSGLADNLIFGPVSEWLKQDGWPYENQTQILSKKQPFENQTSQISNGHYILNLTIIW